MFSSLVTQSIRSGFRIGFDYRKQNLKASTKNLLSALEHPEVVDSYIHNELALGRLVHIPEPTCLSWYHTSPFGVIYTEEAQAREMETDS